MGKQAVPAEVTLKQEGAGRSDGETLVIGATGNVGREVVASLLAKGAAVFRAGQDALPVGARGAPFDFAAPPSLSGSARGR